MVTGDAADPRFANIVETGRIRLGLFLPQYAETATGGIEPLGAGLVANALIGALADRLGIDRQIIRQPDPPKAMETLNAGGCDVMIIGIEESRRTIVDFTPPVIQFDFAYLVPPGSALRETAEVDRPGCRISVPEGHASWMALKRQIAHADIIGTDLPDDAFALVRDGAADVFALPREQLMDYAALLPGARILDEGFGFNVAGLAVAKGQGPRCAFLGDFVEAAKASGQVGRILDEADLTARGFSVAP